MAELSREAVLKYSTNKIGSITSLSYSIDGNVIEANNFDVNAFTEAILGRRTVTISVSGQVDRTDTTGQNLLRSDYQNATKSDPSDFQSFTIEPATTEAGDTSFTGSGVPTSYSEDRADDGDGLATYSVEIRISGTWTETTLT